MRRPINSEHDRDKHMSSRREFLKSATAVPFAGYVPRWNDNRDFKQPFVHLHTHSDYSYPDAIGQIPKMVGRPLAHVR